MSRLIGRIVLFVAAVGLVWFAFFRPRKLVLAGTQPGTSANIGAQANAAASSAINTASNSVNSGISQILGVISNGIATSIRNNSSGAQGGSNSSASDAGTGDFFNLNPPLAVADAGDDWVAL